MGRFGMHHPGTLASANDLGLLLQGLGRFEDAETFIREALMGWEQKFTRDHPGYYASANNLGLLLRAQGKHGEAELLLRRASEGWEQKLGADHPNARSSAFNLNSLLDKRHCKPARPFKHFSVCCVTRTPRGSQRASPKA